MVDNLKGLERRMELREREERRRNMVIRGMEGEDGRRREVVEGLFKEIGAEAKIEDIKIVGGQKEKGKVCG